MCSTTCLSINCIQIEWIYHSKDFVNHHLVLIAFTRCALRHLRFTFSSISKRHPWHVMLPTKIFTASFIIIVASLAGLTYFKEQLAMKPPNFLCSNISFVHDTQNFKSREEAKSSYSHCKHFHIFKIHVYVEFFHMPNINWGFLTALVGFLWFVFFSKSLWAIVIFFFFIVN